MFYVIVNLPVSKNENISYHYTHIIKSVNITQPLHVYFFPRMFMYKKKNSCYDCYNTTSYFKTNICGKTTCRLEGQQVRG